MKKTKVIIPALGILLLSTAASVTGTVAWFTAANDVDVSGLQFKAQSEQAIVVSNEGKTSWLNSGVSASHNGQGATFLTTSTADFTNWYHAYSSDANNGQATVDRVQLTVNKPSAGTTSSDTGLGVVSQTDTSAKDYNFNAQNVYLLNRFYVQSATQIALESQDLYIKDLAVSGATTNAALDASLRVGFAYDTEGKFIFAPVAGATETYNVYTAAETPVATSVTAIKDTSSGVVISGSAGVNIPAYSANGTSALPIEVFIWFEGEDANNKSANVLGNMDNLSITFKIGNKLHA